MKGIVITNILVLTTMAFCLVFSKPVNVSTEINHANDANDTVSVSIKVNRPVIVLSI